MREITLNVYTFDELSAEAKERAKHDYAESEGYAWASEALKSLDALAGHFCVRLHDYSIDYFGENYRSYATFDMPEMEPDEIEQLLNKLGSYNAQTLKGNGECVLTGFCADEDAIDGFRAAWFQGERNLTALMKAAFDSWLKAQQAECAAQYEDENFAEHCQANDCEFYATGEMYVP